MKLPQLPLTELPQLLHFHPITLNGLSPVHLGGHPIDAGVALLFTPPHTPGKPLLTASPSLILSQSHVLTLSKSDRHLHDALVAAGEDLSQSPRGACMVLLLLRQSTAAGLATPLGSVRDAWLEYVQFLPTEIPLPTTWTSAELTLLAGTSLESAVAAKLRALNYEFEAYAKAVAALEWWDTEGLVLADWVHADAQIGRAHV